MKNRITSDFADNLSDLIKESGKTLHELSSENEIGISTGALSKYQNDAAEPGITALDKISEYFEVSYDFLLGKSRNRSRENVNIGEYLGLCDKAIQQIHDYYATYQSNSFNVKFLNKFLENKSFKELLNSFGMIFTNYASLQFSKDESWLQHKADEEIEDSKRNYGMIVAEREGAYQEIKNNEITSEDLASAQSLIKENIISATSKNYRFSMWQSQEILKTLIQEIIQEAYSDYQEGSERVGQHNEETE
jgi:Helix-turn-helix.